MIVQIADELQLPAYVFRCPPERMCDFKDERLPVTPALVYAALESAHEIALLEPKPVAGFSGDRFVKESGDSFDHGYEPMLCGFAS